MQAGGEQDPAGPGKAQWPDWRDAAAYRPLLGADRSAFAWEWLRRNPDYCRDATAAEPAKAPRIWGLARYCDPHLTFLDARPLWLAGFDPQVIRAEVLAGPPGAHGITGLGSLFSAFQAAAGLWHCLASDGYRSIRLDVAGEWDGASPIDLRFLLDGLDEASRLLPAMRALAQLCRSGRFPDMSYRSQAARRHILMLRAHDALATGAGQRAIAEQLIDRDCAAPNWRDRLPSVRSRAQRLVREARRMGEGGYRRLLRG